MPAQPAPAASSGSAARAVEIVDRGGESRRARRLAARCRAEMAEADEAVAHGITAAGRPCRDAAPSPSIGVGVRHRLVELDAEARRRRRNHVAVLPADRRLQDLGVEAAPVAGCSPGSGSWASRRRAGCWRRPRSGRSRGAGRSGRSGSRPCRRSSWPRAGRRPGRGSSAGSRRRRSASTRANSYLVVSRSPVAIGIVRGARDRRHLLRHLRRHRLLEPERVVRLQPLARGGWRRRR